MTRRRWVAVGISLVILLGIAFTLYRLPHIVRNVAINRLHALTQRPVEIDAVQLDLLTGRFTIRGLRVADRDGTSPFVDFDRLDLRLNLPSLLVGHLWVREVVLTGPTVRVVRLSTNELNFSDLLRGSGATGKPID